jgi:aspartyl protease family protein
MMRIFAPLAFLAIALAVLLATPDERLILGLDHARFAQAAVGVALLWWIVFAAARRVGARDFLRAFTGALVWAALLAGLVGVYAYRFEFSDIADRVIAELDASEPVVGQGGEVIVSRRLGGEFLIKGKVGGGSAWFLFDTGASTVVLRAEDASRMGVDTSNLSYDVRVTTANGSALAAETVLDQVSVGPITVRHVRALIAKPGALAENLLGMSFLEKLQSYTVERGRLILKAGQAA